jgi:hypothetical protein
MDWFKQQYATDFIIHPTRKDNHTMTMALCLMPRIEHTIQYEP